MPRGGIFQKCTARTSRAAIVASASVLTKGSRHKANGYIDWRDAVSCPQYDSLILVAIIKRFQNAVDFEDFIKINLYTISQPFTNLLEYIVSVETKVVAFLQPWLDFGYHSRHAMISEPVLNTFHVASMLNSISSVETSCFVHRLVRM